MKSIVDELEQWAEASEPHLIQWGIQLTRRFPERGANERWKASVGLVRENLIASFTVWERVPLQTELLVMDAKNGETIVMVDENPAKAEIIADQLNQVVSHLRKGTFAS